MRNPKTNTSILTPFLLAILTIGLGFGILGAYGTIKTATAEETIDVSDVEVSHEIEQITNEIGVHRTKLQEVEAKRKELEDQLNLIERQTYSLQQQTLLVDSQIKDTEFEIQKKVLEIDQRKLEIERLSMLIDEKQVEIDASKERLSSLIRVIDQNDRESHLFILFSRDSFSTYLDDLRSAADLQVNIQEEVQGLKEAKQELDDQKLEQEKISKELQEARDALEHNRETLEQQLVYQQELVNQSKAQELPYEQLISEVSKEQDFLDSQVRSLESQAKEKILSLNNGIISDKNVPLSWPVSSINKPGLNKASCINHETCSAVFGYDDYYFDGLYHYGVDIPVQQGTPVYAAADGFVAYPFYPGGTCTGYSCTSALYIQHVDDSGIATEMYTAYFHLSKAAVSYSPDVTFVTKGQIIGYAGGKRGTMGAGFSTGSHLHFAVSFGRPSKGNYVNPLNYLP